MSIELFERDWTYIESGELWLILECNGHDPVLDACVNSNYDDVDHYDGVKLRALITDYGWTTVVKHVCEALSSLGADESFPRVA